MRGQAFVVCGDEDQASQAINQLRNNMFFGKPLRLSYSKKTSDVVAKLKGQFDENVYAVRKAEQNKGLANKEVKKKLKMIQRLYALREQIRIGQNSMGGPQMIHPGQAPMHGAGYGRPNYDEPSGIPQ